MAWRNKKKQDDNGASYFENVGKTESVGGGAFGGGFDSGFGKTESGAGGAFGGSFGGNFGKTEAVQNGGWGAGPVQNFSATASLNDTIPADSAFIPGTEPSPVVEDFGKTQSAYTFPAAGPDGGTQPVQVQPVVGWLVCVQGRNIGKSFQIYTGYNQVGRENGQIIVPDEPKLSRTNHMVVTYDPRGRMFYIGTGDGLNIIYVNGKPLFGGSGAELHNYDVIETGDVIFRFIGFCGEQFSWD